jgi:hypothetical protein
MHTKIAGFAIFAVACVPTLALAVEESKSESIGPWEIEATYKADKFDRCTVSRKLENDIVASFIRTNDEALTFMLESPNWKLERGKQYPVKMSLGPQSWDTEVAAEASSVSIGVDQKKFESGLRNASALNVVAAGATIHVPLDKSRVALERLENCVAKNERAAETNPFVAPARQP